MSHPTETTRLLKHTNETPYVFDSSIERKRRVKQFQCCVCAIFLSIFSAIVVILVAYSIKNEGLPPENATSVDEIQIAPLDTVVVLFNKDWPLLDSKNKNDTIDENSWDEAIAAGKKELQVKDKIENSVPSLQLNSASYKHQKVTATSEMGRNMSKAGLVEEYATRHLHSNKTDRGLVKTVCNENGTTVGEYCQRKIITCNIFHKYRSYNGTCNNLIYPGKYGVSYRPYRRVLPPDYADGISKPRRAKNGDLLPSARTVSLVVHRPYYRDDPKFTVMLAVWGQFLDHDITATALSQKSNGSTISCCNNLGILSPECFPVMLDSEDPLREYNISCIEFVRSAPAPTCCLGPREQLNQVTPLIDASVIYGADEQLANTLRDLENGTMKVLRLSDGRALLPISKDLNDGCNREEEQRNGRYCFMTGDSRSNENLHLTTMHLLWVRQHNLLARNLSNLNSHWSDERIYQECRRIIAAQMQHITYNEFLPILLGNKLMKKFDLYPRRKGYFHKYNESIDPAISNNFATASFRFAHSIIPGLMKLLADQNSTPEFIQMHKMLFNPFELYKPHGLDDTLRGAINTSIEASDSYFTDELKSHMFEMHNEKSKQQKKYGLDLVSLNVQRGRDHGLPSYTLWREYCGLSKPRTMDDLKNSTDKNTLHNIKSIYKTTDDIDLYTGALSEKPIKGGILGPTITCLILDQFYRLKYGDRFWYENYQEPQAFSNDQLNEIRKTTLANIICDNSDDIKIIQEKVMERNGKKNDYIPCSQINKPNLIFWKENFIRVEMQRPG